jgi:hypothetical protein
MNYEERGAVGAPPEQTRRVLVRKGGQEHRDAVFPEVGALAFAVDMMGCYGQFTLAVQDALDDELCVAPLPATVVVQMADDEVVEIVTGRIRKCVDDGANSVLEFMDGEWVFTYAVVGLKF